jgi:hypothetical protein
MEGCCRLSLFCPIPEKLSVSCCFFCLLCCLLFFFFSAFRSRLLRLFFTQLRKFGTRDPARRPTVELRYPPPGFVNFGSGRLYGCVLLLHYCLSLRQGEGLISGMIGLVFHHLWNRRMRTFRRMRTSPKSTESMFGNQTTMIPTQKGPHEASSCWRAQNQASKERSAANNRLLLDRFVTN